MIFWKCGKALVQVKQLAPIYYLEFLGLLEAIDGCSDWELKSLYEIQICDLYGLSPDALEAILEANKLKERTPGKGNPCTLQEYIKNLIAWFLDKTNSLEVCEKYPVDFLIDLREELQPKEEQGFSESEKEAMLKILNGE
jgi:hypothetical protein